MEAKKGYFFMYKEIKFYLFFGARGLGGLGGGEREGWRKRGWGYVFY